MSSMEEQQLKCPDDYSNPPLTFLNEAGGVTPACNVVSVNYSDGNVNFNDALGDTDEDDDYADDIETTCPGQSFTKEQESKIRLESIYRYADETRRHSELCRQILRAGDQSVPVPPGPLKILPETTFLCINKEYCYHREYMTSDISETSSVLGFRKPWQMLQVFSLRLSSSESHPISVYGTVSVSDFLEPLRNHVFNRPRDDPVTIEQDAFTLPLCSPCRGMYVLERALLEVDLSVKKEGDGSADEQLLCAYVEIYRRSTIDTKLKSGRISKGNCTLDIDYTFLCSSIEAVIEVAANVNDPHHVRFTAFSGDSVNEIVLFNGKVNRRGKLFRYVVAVKARGRLDVCLESEGSLFRWTFLDGAVGATSLPDDDSIVNQYEVRVFFAPKNLQNKPYLRYLAREERCSRKR